MEALGILEFRCNVCGAACKFPAAALSREEISCYTCGSTVRMRAMVNAVSIALFGRSIALPDFPQDKSIAGVGLSDWPGYADRLSAKLGYRNTWYHMEPRLDITNIGEQDVGTVDFVLSTDVFEHVCPPVSRAFECSLRMLKPYGALVFSVPYNTGGSTVEHFPDLHDFSIEQRPEGYVLLNVTRTGEKQEFDKLIFHGGPGDTLEMRMFSGPDLLRQLADAGFADVQVLGEPCFEFGIWHSRLNSLPIIARREPARVRVEAFGPTSITRADGSNVDKLKRNLWMRLDREWMDVPFEVRIGDELAISSASRGVITVAIPAAVQATPGSHAITIATPGNGRPVAAGALRVV